MEPLPGVNVVIQGTTNGTVTNMDGVYEIQADEGAILEFSFIGYFTQIVPLSDLTIIDILLVTDEEALEEVIVVGYGHSPNRKKVIKHTRTGKK